jgi:CDP-paratose 2-epimerase
VSEAQPLDFHSPYGCSKGTADQYVRDYHRIYGLRTVVFRQSAIYAYDAATARIDQVAGRAYNMGGGPQNTISVWAEFSTMLEKLLGKAIPVAHDDWRPGDQRVCVYDISKAARELDWQPRLPVKAGVEKLYRWVRENAILFE